MFPETTLNLKIELAFGATGDDPLSWVWTDVSARLLAQTTGIRRGRADESAATTPADMTVVLDNGDGALTPYHTGSPFYPNVRRGTPMRVSVPGADVALVVPGVAGAYASTPDHPTLDITGDLDVRVRVQPDQWATVDTPIVLTNNQVLIAKADADERSYQLSVAELGFPVAVWSPDGTFVNEQIAAGNQLVAALKPIWFGQTVDVDNGAGQHVVTFYRFDGDPAPADITTWTVIETLTRSGTTSIFGSTSPLEIGSSDLGTETDFRGRILGAQVRDGINGTLAADPNFTAQTPGATSFTDSTGKLWTINGTAEISDQAIRFVGSVGEFSPYWPYGDNNAAAATVPSEARVTITASGILRRLSQGAKPLRSTLYRHITSRRYLPSVLGYWPCEDGDQAAALASGVPDTTTSMTINASVDTAADDSLAAAAPLPTIRDNETGTWSASVPITGGTDWEFWMFFKIPTMEPFTSRTQLVELQTSGTAAKWIFEISEDDTRFRVLDTVAATLVDQTVGSADYSDKWMILRIAAEEVFGTIDWRWDLIEIDTGNSGGTFGSFSGTGGPINTIVNSTVGPTGGLSFGHLIVTTFGIGTSWLAAADTAWAGESAAHRFFRLCREESVPVEIIGDPTVAATSRGDLTLSEPMGPQRRNTLLDLLRECVDLELGMMIERRRSPGLVFRTRRSLEAQSTVALALNGGTAGEVENPFHPTLDDQRLRNDITVTTIGGSSARATDPASIAAEGLYEIQPELVGVGGLNIQSAIVAAQTGLQDAIDNQNANQANRRLYLATWPTMRYPTVTFDLGTANHLLAAFQDTELGDRVTVEGLPDQHPTGTVELLLEHIHETITNVSWRPALTCSPGGPWLTPFEEPEPVAHTVEFRSQQTLATTGQPDHVLTALGHTDPTPITRAQLDGILDTWVAGTGGTTRNVTSLATWNTAVGAAVPGDLIRVTAGFDALIDVRGNRYGIAGANLTTSPAGGTAGNPIIVTCADGVYVDDNNITSNAGVLDLTNCEHVWAVGFNVRDGQFGIRCQNWGGSAADPAYVAYCNIDNIGDAGLVGEGWFQAITSSGGTPPAGAGNEWGFSQWGVFEENTVTDPGRRIGGNPGECVYLGHGGSPGWIAYTKDFWVRGNELTGWTSDGIDCKPGCHRTYITDNEIHTGYAINGAPISILYVAASIDDRPAAFDFDPELYVEGNRVYDNDITDANGSSVHIMGYIGLSGIRIAHNVFWAHPQTGTHATWRARNEKGTNDTEALAEYRNDTTYVINNTCWGDDSFENAGYGAPLVGPFPGSITFDLRNNIVDQASPATGEVDAAASDFIAAVPAIGAAGAAQWLTYGNGSAFDLDPGSALVAAGVSVTDITFLIEADISQRTLDKSTPNPGAFHQHPANL